MAFVRLVLPALLLLRSTAFASAPCPPPPPHINFDAQGGFDAFFEWCLNVVKGEPRQDLAAGVSMGCYDCENPTGQVQWVSPSAALFLGLPATSGALATLLDLMSRSDEDMTDWTESFGRTYAIGAGVGLGLALTGYGIVMLGEVSPPAALALGGSAAGATGGLFLQNLANDRKPFEQREADKESGKAADEYKTAAAKGALVGGVALPVVGELTKRLSLESEVLAPFFRRHPWLSRATLFSAPSWSGGTRLGVVVR